MHDSSAAALAMAGVSMTFRPLRLPWQRVSQAAPGDDNPEKSSVVKALDNIDLTIERGQIYGILGPNGSGKSTLIRIVSTLIIPDAGEVSVFGLDLRRDEAAIKRLINRVSVEASFFKKLSPMENLLFGAQLYGIDRKTARQRAVEILLRLGLRERSIYESMEQMSRGMQQKVAIARAFLTDPILLLLDEPTTGLDPRSKREVQQVVAELRREHGATVLLTTHDMQEAEALCDRVAIIDGGRIVADGTAAELKANVAIRPGYGDHVPSLEDVFMALTGHELVSEEAA